jgi:hypothetical protein
MAVRLKQSAYFIAFLFTALALGPALAHLFALPNKIELPEAQYFVAQGVYRGWALLGIVVIGALLSTLALSVVLRHERRPMAWAIVAFLCIAGTQAIFWTWTYPANAATANWTMVPQNWEALRTQWEYSHAASAFLNLAAMVALILSVLSWQRTD